jgi:hypothetical protein
MSSLICNACQIQIHSDEERAAHYKSEWHRYNVKRRCAGLASIPQQLFDSQLTALNNKKAAEASQKADQNCKTCKKSFATASAYQAHMASKKHLKKVEKQGEGGPDEDDEDESGAASSSSPAASKQVASSGESKEDAMDTDEALEEGEEEEEGEAIPLLHCLFCTQSFTQMQSNVDHMLKQHGFFIPFIENLVDLEGLLTYLGEKIGIGHVCLWCNGAGRARYPSTSAVQKHMKAKSHCKLNLEGDEEEEELMDYYDFDLEEEEEGQWDSAHFYRDPAVRTSPKRSSLCSKSALTPLSIFSSPCFQMRLPKPPPRAPPALRRLRASCPSPVRTLPRLVVRVVAVRAASTTRASWCSLTARSSARVRTSTSTSSTCVRRATSWRSRRTTSSWR